MTRELHIPRVDPALFILPVEKGGTSATTAAAARANLRLLGTSDLAQVAQLNSLAKIPDSLLPASGSGSTVKLDGDSTMMVSTQRNWVITNYDSYTSYTVTAASGTVVRNVDLITYTAPATAGTYGFTLNGELVPVTVISTAPVVAITPPRINAPVNSAANVGTPVGIFVTTYALADAADTNYNALFEIWTDASFTDQTKKVFSQVITRESARQSTSEFSVNWNGGQPATVYYVRVQASSTLQGTSAWSSTVSFTTAIEHLFLETAIIVASHSQIDDHFGGSLSLSLDGSRCAIGSYGNNLGMGAVYVFLRTGTTWTQEVRLPHPEGTSLTNFGYSVSLSNDGSSCAVGAFTDDGNKGSVYIFTRTGTTWTFQTKLLALDSIIGSNFGYSVSISSDGTRCVIGAFINSGGTSKGSAYVFSRTSTVWTQEAKLVAADGVIDDMFGAYVSISSDGTRCVIGAFSSGSKGAVYVFLRTGTTWTQEAKLIASDGVTGDCFGLSVSLSSNGTRCVIGAFGTESNRGSAYVFSRTGTVWTQEAKLVAADGANHDRFGESVSISSSGDKVLTAAPYKDSVINEDRGSGYMFTRTGTTWLQQTPPLTGDGVYLNQGKAVSLSGDSQIAAFGQPSGNGFVFIFS